MAPRRPAVLETHGDRRVDDWLWLRDRDDPDLLALLRSENAYTAAATAHLTDFHEHLFAEIRSRIVETDLSVPVRKDGWWYYTRTVEGRDYAIHCRLPVEGYGRDPDTPPGTDPPGTETSGAGADLGTWPDEQVLLDENLLAGPHPYLDVANLSVSPGHGRLAYAVDTTGDERFTMRVRDLATGADLAEEIEGTSYGVAWANDNETVFFTRPDAANRTYQLWRHTLGSSTADDVLVYEETDERFHLGVDRTKDGAFIVLELHSKVTAEVHVIDADRPLSAPRVVEPRHQGIEYQVEHHGDTFLLLTNDAAENFRVVATPAADPGRDRWTEVIAHRHDVRLEGLDVFFRHLVSYERLDGNPRVRVIPLPADGSAWQRPLPGGTFIPIAEIPSASWGGPNPDFASTILRYDYSSLVTPRSIFDLDMDSGGSVLRKQQPVLGGYDPAAYATERLWATAPDGTRIPISVVHRRDTPRDGSAPCLLYGYGAYEHSIDPVFSTFRLSLLERGFVFAIAHVRGGGELGRRWYEGGKLLAKPNTFTDFVACARHLVDCGWTSPRRLVARGGSAGGLLIGAAANLAPDAFRAMVAEVPFVDCLTTILDDTLPLTVIEWEEWGNPGADPEIYAVMKSYSPYDNVRPVRYPAMLVTAGLEDPRVGYWEPTKWVQKLRAADPANHILFKVELTAGHAGPSGRYDAWRDEAFVLAFVLDAVGRAR
ncbi:MAG TPA: S9 family peptidase [Acidimicrobiales bacterium]|nr:S9 family peptidase [Acidimicrobiales bacterium]